MISSLQTSWVQPAVISRHRQLLTLCLAYTLFWPSIACAAVDTHQVPIHISVSGDFTDLAFVAFRSTNLSTAKIVSVDGGVSFPVVGGVDSVVVIAVPRDLADKLKDQVDLAWFQPSAPDVTRVGIVEPPFAYRDLVVRYEVVKTGNRPTLKLLNAAEYDAAQTPPVYIRPQNSIAVNDSYPPMYFWAFAVATGIVLAGGTWIVWRRRKKKSNPANVESQSLNAGGAA